MTNVSMCAAALHEHKACLRYLLDVWRAELPIYWEHDGQQCKARIDAETHGGALVEVKTCASLDRWTSECARYLYPMQLAWYHDGLEAVGRRPSSVVMLVVEKSAPFDCACYIVPDSVLELGREEYKRALRILSECERTGEWPGRYPGETLLTLPDWAYQVGHPDEEAIVDDD